MAESLLIGLTTAGLVHVLIVKSSSVSPGLLIKMFSECPEFKVHPLCRMTVKSYTACQSATKAVNFLRNLYYDRGFSGKYDIRCYRYLVVDLTSIGSDFFGHYRVSFLLLC